MFGVLLNIVTPFLNKTTVDALKVFGPNKEEWSKALLEEIDADQLPAYFGGKATDPDGNPKCPSKVKRQDFAFSYLYTKFLIYNS